jgi:transcriptional regulator with GAF, ATPase, and Fis domain
LLTNRPHEPGAFADIVTQNSAMFAIFRYIEAVAASPQPVLVSGETGTGKELIANALHQASKRPGDLVAVNVAGLDDHMFSDTLFGHAKGAFTGADRPRDGLVTSAGEGTLFLDEIGDLPLSSQVKILRVLQEREVVRLGSRQSIPIDVRLIAATNVNLLEAVQAGRFREDLYYRLNVASLDLLPLRQRPGDILPLVWHFMERYGKKLHLSSLKLTADAERALLNYGWPGNIRELQHIIERAVILSNDSELATVKCIDLSGGDQTSAAAIVTLEEAERSHILKALEATSWRIAGEGGAAQILGVPSTTLRSKMDKLRIKKE